MARAVVVPAARLAVSPRPSTELAAQALEAAGGGDLGRASFVIVAGQPDELLEALDALQGAGVTVPDGLELDRPTG